MKRTSTLVTCILLYTAAFSQSPDASVLASAGGVNSNGKMSLEWTLGEASVSTLSYGSNLLTEGYHQPIIIISNTKRPELVKAIINDLNITIAPNPVMSILTVTFTGKFESRLHLSLMNVSGKLLWSKDQFFKSNTTTIAMEHLPGGVYFLRINDSQRVLKTFEIIKL